MKRPAPVLWILLAALSAGLLLLVDPFAWFGDQRPAEPIAPATKTADDAGREQLGTDAEVAPAAAPGRTIERRAVDRLVEAGLVAFRVVAGADRPVAGAQVLVVRGERLLCDERTDANGEVELAADARPAGLVVAVERRPLEWRDVVLEAGRQEIVLADGARVSGRFVREDGVATGRLSFSFDSDHAFPSIPSLPAVVEEAVAATTLNRAYAIVNTDEEGGFEFTGLPGSWSGRLLLRGGFKVASASHGDITPGARGIRLMEPTSDLVVRIAPHRVLQGRLVLRDDGSPLGGARLSTMLRSPDLDDPVFSSAVTDEAGHFEVEVRQPRISGFDLRLGGRFHECPSILVLDAANVPADGDLGDVVVDAVRHVPFLLQDPDGEPVARGVAVAAGTRSARTGKDGRGELRWIARSVDRMAVEASGFVPAEREIPPVVVDPLVVTLQPANELVVSLALPEGADPGLFKVVLRGDERITAVPVEDAAGQRRHVSAWAYPLVELVGASRDTYLCGKPDASRRSVRFHALRPGVPIELEVHGITGDMVYHREPVAPLRPAEHRELEVSLEDGMIVFRGRVLTQDGAPLARASLQLTNQILGWTDEEGAFLCFLATPETGTLLVSHRSCTTKYLRDYAVPTDGVPVEFRLSPTRSVTIEVVDENGAPVPQAEVWTMLGGFITNTNRIEGHRHAASAPEEPFDIVVRLAGREYRQQHDPAVPDARVVVPVHGRVVAPVADAALAGRAGRFVLVLAPLGTESAQPVSEHRDSTPGLRIEIPAVHPGTYEAWLRYVPSKDEQDAGREEISSERARVEIEPGKETEIRLALPARGG